MFTVRQLRPGDEAVLGILATDAVDFGMSDDGRALAPLGAEQARAYLRNAAVIHWVAFEGELPVGTLVVMQLHLPILPGLELLLHEIGVRETHRRQGVGTALLRAMDVWMRANHVATVWLLADGGEGAESFYASCGFRAEPEQPTYMLRTLDR